MKRFERLGWLSVATVVVNLCVWTTVEGCSGDDTGTDGGDGSIDQTSPDVKQDVIIPNEAGDVVTADQEAGGFDASQILAFQTAFATQWCQRLGSCCYETQLDAGVDDAAVSACIAFTESLNGGGLENAIGDLADPLAVASGHIVIDDTAKASCLAGLATMTCNNISGTEYDTLAQNCLEALGGNIPVGQPGCRRSVECDNGFCEYPDGSTTLAPDASGTCVAISGSGGNCDPRGGGNDQCMYRGWLGSPPLRCDTVEGVADTCGTTGNPTFKCTPKLDNDAGCYFEWECASGACGGNDCACQPANGPIPFPYFGVCPTYFPDAGLN